MDHPKLHRLEVDLTDSNNPVFYLDEEEKASKKSKGGRRHPFIVLVCGGRDYNDAGLLGAVIDNIDIAVMIHGNCLGSADTMAAWYFGTNFVMQGFSPPIRRYPVERDGSCRGAGYPRNRQMLEEEDPDLVLAFPGGDGTQNLVDLALGKQIPVLQISRRKAN